MITLKWCFEPCPDLFKLNLDLTVHLLLRWAQILTQRSIDQMLLKWSKHVCVCRLVCLHRNLENIYLSSCGLDSRICQKNCVTYLDSNFIWNIRLFIKLFYGVSGIYPAYLFWGPGDSRPWIEESQTNDTTFENGTLPRVTKVWACTDAEKLFVNNKHGVHQLKQIYVHVKIMKH